MKDEHTDSVPKTGRRPYLAPAVEVVRFRTEKGYAMSDGDGVLGRIESERADLINIIFDEEGNGGAVSIYEQHNDWGNNWEGEGWF